MQTVYLSRRNILTLLSKLDRQKAGEETACAIDLLNGNIINVPPPAAMGDGVIVVPVSDEEMYANRSAGEMHPADEANLPKPATGVIQHEGLPPPRRWVY